ncbi:neutral zinc metallopeptidase [Nonomuraea sp. NPDC047897]|uniref:neutral zinc metallopeptidase n=1 Tax=Nonomuraea sp. NPDC047897 TaxID=3364346 RepID=UPI0037139E73
MRIRPLSVLACAALIPLASPGAAAAQTAYPVKNATLTKNALYGAGALPTTTCAEKKVRANDRVSAKAYLDGIVECLDATWQQHLTGAGLPFKKIRVKHVTKTPKKWCGFITGKSNSQAYYCGNNNTLMIQLGRSWLSEPHDLWLAYVASSMYGMHVQNQSGISAAYDKLSYRSTAEDMEQTRRLNLQAECLGGAFLKSVWPLDGRHSRDWQQLLGLMDGDGWSGKTSSIKAWLRAGYATGDPGSCNTWVASSTKVA